MPKMIQIRNVPDDLHSILKARAALVGMTLSDYLLDGLRHQAAKPTVAELRERLATRSVVDTSLSGAQAVRLERDSR